MSEGNRRPGKVSKRSKSQSSRSAASSEQSCGIPNGCHCAATSLADTMSTSKRCRLATSHPPAALLWLVKTGLTIAILHFYLQKKKCSSKLDLKWSRMSLKVSWFLCSQSGTDQICDTDMEAGKKRMNSDTVRSGSANPSVVFADLQRSDVWAGSRRHCVTDTVHRGTVSVM